MSDALTRYAREKTAAGFNSVHYGVGGVHLFASAELMKAQTGYSVTSEGISLVGEKDGDWCSDWFVIGNETACGDPIFLSIESPYPVFTAMHGQGSWNAKQIAASLDDFWKCLNVFARFANGRSNPLELQANPPTEAEVTVYLENISRLCQGNEDAVEFWAVQAEIGM